MTDILIQNASTIMHAIGILTVLTMWSIIGVLVIGSFRYKTIEGMTAVRFFAIAIISGGPFMIALFIAATIMWMRVRIKR